MTLKQTFLPVVLDLDRSAVVSDDVLPVDPGAVPQVLVVNNLDSSLQNLCQNQSAENIVL